MSKVWSPLEGPFFGGSDTMDEMQRLGFAKAISCRVSKICVPYVLVCATCVISSVPK